jgi:hypothetical protein
MPMIRFACPSCGMAASAPEECAGRSAKCRGCNNPIVVPQAVTTRVPQPPAKQAPPRDKTALGRVISHTPTSVKPPISSASPPAPNYPSIKPKKPTKSAAPPRQEAVEPRKRSLLAKLGMIAVSLLAVFVTGGLFGFGVYYYLDSQKKTGGSPGGDSYAQASVRTEEPSHLLREPTPPRDTPEEAKPAPAATDPPPPREEAPPTPRNEERPPKKEESPPPAREEPPTRTEPKPPREGPILPRELRPLVARLNSGTMEERVKSAADLAALGDKARPAVGALCDAAASPSQEVSRAALEALEKVNPELYKPIFVLLVDEQAVNHRAALTTLAALGEQGKPATPIVLHEISRCRALFADPSARWGLNALIQVTNDSMKTLPKIAADDLQALSAIIDLTKLSLPNPTQIRTKKGRFGVTITTSPFREDGLELLGGLAEGHPYFRKQIIPPVVAILKESAQHTNAPNEYEVLAAIAAIDQAGDTLLKCGAEAKQTLTKEVIPQLKDLKFHKSENVRKTAANLRKKIEDAP